MSLEEPQPTSRPLILFLLPNNLSTNDCNLTTSSLKKHLLQMTPIPLNKKLVVFHILSAHLLDDLKKQMKENDKTIY